MNTTKIMFKGDKLGIKIIIDKDLPFEEVENEFRKKVTSVKNMFSNVNIGITFIGKELTDVEQKILLDILSKECGLEVDFTINEAYVKKYLNTPLVQKENKVLEKPRLERLQSRVDRVMSEKENNTIFHKGSLRSGSSIKHNGSIVIIGDVNAGAEVIAEGHIIVIGSVKGVVQAGCAGNKSCFIFALNLLPIQIRIGDIISFLPKEEKRLKSDIKPEIAYVDDEKIFISEFNKF